MTTARRLASRRTLALVLVLAPATAHATYSVVATDRASGQVGGAVTSCVGSQGVGVVYRPSVGHGGVNAQASASATGRDRAVVLLDMDVAPADIITMITAPSFDSNAAVRQYGVVDLMGRAAGFTGGNAMSYKEDRQGSLGSYTYSVQGNILTSRAVIDQAESAFRNGGCDLADKLMRALDGGAMNGEGDSRCTPRGYPSDAASIEVDLTGEPAGAYLRLSVAGGNMNAVTRMRTMFDAWRTTHPCAVGGSGGTGGVGGRGGAGGTNGASGGRGGAGGLTGGGGTSGMAGAGGTSGAAGAGGTSGAAGAGGTSGMAGATGASGTTGSAGTGAGGPTDAGTTTPGDAGGCSCAVSARSGASSFILVVALALLRRRRRH